MRPEYAEEVRLKQQSEGVMPREDLAEREIEEHDREERELEYLEPGRQRGARPRQGL